jgi:hypothetical protein
MSNKEIFILIFCPIFIGAPGCALLYYVFRCLKNGKVGGGNKFGKSKISTRKDDPTSYWGLLMVYFALGAWLVYLACSGTYHFFLIKGTIHH